MKQLITRTLAMLGLLVMSVTTIANAQVTTQVIKVTIPFEFSVGDKRFPAGHYSLTAPVQHLVALRDARGQTIASFFTSGIDSSSIPATSKLRFDNSNGTPALVEIWQQQDSLGQRLVPTKAQFNVARHRADASRDAAQGSEP
jgi:hypothetical protein